MSCVSGGMSRRTSDTGLIWGVKVIRQTVVFRVLKSQTLIEIFAILLCGMDKIKEIWDSLKDRFTNPLIFSFLCAWMFCNWRILVALFWYDSIQIEKEGFETIYQFINTTLNWTNGFWWPLLVSFIYTFIIPFLKVIISAFYTKLSSWSENWNLSIIKNGQISIGKYLSLRENYNRRTKILEEVISQEEETQNKYEALRSEHFETQKQLNERNADYQSLRDIQVLQGSWINNYQGEDGINGSEEILIEGSAYYILSSFGQKQHTFDIVDFIWDRQRKKVFFVKELVHEQKKN